MVADGGAAIEGPTTIGSSLRIVNLNALEFGYNIDGFGHIRNDGVSLEIFGVGTKARKIRMVADGGVTLIGPMNIDGTNTLEFGAGVSGKQVNAGKIGYQALTDYALDIVGAGTDLTNRKIKFWAEGGALFNGTAWVEGALRFKWGSDWRAITLRSGDFAGAETFGGGLPPSDIRFKTALRPISDALEKVLQLNGRYYRWNQAGLRHFTRDIADALSAGPDATEADNQKLWDAERQKAHQALSGDRIGLIAQELETVVPELIHEDKEGYKYVRYEQLTALLVEAIKQQHALIQSLSDRLAAAEAR
jgi:hypothetical protein